jgi:co-chaperonin GroES (HSP10)
MGLETIQGKLRPIRDHVLVSDLEDEAITLKSGIFIPSRDAKTSGIKPRWAKVYAIGPDQTDVKVGEWIYVDHGRWTRGVKIQEEGKEMTIRRVDGKDILISTDHKPDDVLLQYD